ncbi:hypothetical protein FOZ61_008312 [Perkinsus olseni]|uniref:Uncharacterized protein n=1 Tax=Perkinsus olseni TaxID=32597 RepID=A0A7J6LHV3_PEROL|nr:hypothetical protein FOZ61_008312 [Perkinsus olseni]KAF4658867.1 hypothetical protein FOL46_006800 [Perkinsus olseni]
MLRFATVIAAAAIGSSTLDEGILSVARGHSTFRHSQDHTDEFTDLDRSGKNSFSDGLTRMTNSRALLRAPHWEAKNPSEAS